MDTFTLGLVLFGASMLGIGALVTWARYRLQVEGCELGGDRCAYHDVKAEYPDITPQ